MLKSDEMPRLATDTDDIETTDRLMPFSAEMALMASNTRIDLRPNIALEGES